MRALLSIASICCIVSTPALAQSQDAGVIYQKVTEIDMTGVDVNATVDKPLGTLHNERRRAEFNPMIKLRKDFDDEVDQSVDQVR